MYRYLLLLSVEEDAVERYQAHRIQAECDESQSFLKVSFLKARVSTELNASVVYDELPLVRRSDERVAVSSSVEFEESTCDRIAGQTVPLFSHSISTSHKIRLKNFIVPSSLGSAVKPVAAARVDLSSS